MTFAKRLANRIYSDITGENISYIMNKKDAENFIRDNNVKCNHPLTGKIDIGLNGFILINNLAENIYELYTDDLNEINNEIIRGFE